MLVFLFLGLVNLSELDDGRLLWYIVFISVMVLHGVDKRINLFIVVIYIRVHLVSL